MRFYNYTMIIIGMVVILNLVGLQTPVAGSILGWLGLTDGANFAIQNIKSSTGWSLLTYVFASLAAGGIVIGTFGRAPDIRYTTAGLVLAITGALVADLVSIALYVNSIGAGSGLSTVFSSIFNVIMVGAVVGLFITAISYWQNPN